MEDACGALLGGSDVARSGGEDEGSSRFMAVAVVVVVEVDARLRSQRQNSLDTRVPALNSPSHATGANPP